MRTLIDLGIAGPSNRDPAAALAIEAAGGRVVYVFHDQRMRAELDVAAVPTLYALHRINYGITVTNPQAYVVPFAVILDHKPPTSADLAALTGAGATAIRAYDFSTLVSVRAPDAAIPAILTFSGVSSGFTDGPLGCVG